MTDLLPDTLKRFGKRILEELDKMDSKPTSMLWSDTVKSNTWVLIVAIHVTDEGRKVSKNRALYFRDQISNLIYQKIKDINNEDLDFDFIVVTSDDPFILAISQLVSTDKDAISEIQFNNNSINGINTGKNYIYRLSR